MARAKRSVGRPKGAKGRPSVSVNLRIPPETLEILHRISATREDLQRGGYPAPSRVVVYLADEWVRNNSGQGSRY